jgi:hypothetical protein
MGLSIREKMKCAASPGGTNSFYSTAGHCQHGTRGVLHDWMGIEGFNCRHNESWSRPSM